MPEKIHPDMMPCMKKNCPLPLRFTLIFGLALFSLAGCAQRNVRTGVQTKTSTALGSRIANTAVSQIGRPYRTGGSSPQSGFDCSGLVYWAYGQHGVQAPRATTGQAKAGASISRSRLMPGDIVVFREPSAPNQLHTGIYIGNNNFVHSPNNRSSVRIDSLNAQHWRRAFISGRRIHTPIGRKASSENPEIKAFR